VLGTLAVGGTVLLAFVEGAVVVHNGFVGRLPVIRQSEVKLLLPPATTRG
jgi:hypothetical protein